MFGASVVAVEVVVGQVVDDRERGVRVGQRGLDRGRRQREADRDDQVAVRLDHGVDVRRVLVFAVGLRRGHVNAEVRSGTLQALVAGLVERAVVETAGVGDHAGLVVDGLGRGRLSRRRRRRGTRLVFWGAGACGERECRHGGKRANAQGVLHEMFPQFCGLFHARPVRVFNATRQMSRAYLERYPFGNETVTTAADRPNLTRS